MSAVESIHPALFSNLVDGLYVEAMVMADEARSYFDTQGESVRAAMDVMTRLSFTCESLKVTTRLMHVIAWLLTQRAWQKGELRWEELSDPRYLLGEADAPDSEVLAMLPDQAHSLVMGSQDLYDRVYRLQERIRTQDARNTTQTDSPARTLQLQLERLL